MANFMSGIYDAIDHPSNESTHSGMNKKYTSCLISKGIPFH